MSRQKKSTKQEPKPVGRPPLVLDEDQVFKLASLNVSVKDMADILGCSKRALEINYMDLINKGRANLRASILRKQYEVGVNGGNVGMLIWLGKQHCDQQDKSHLELERYDYIELLIGAQPLIDAERAEQPSLPENSGLGETTDEVH